MKIEELTAGDIDQIADGLKTQLRKFADQKHEEALITGLNGSNKTDKQKLRDYLVQTRLRPHVACIYDTRAGIKNQYVERQLRLHRHKLKKVRDELEAEGLITTFVDHDGILRICPTAW